MSSLFTWIASIDWLTLTIKGGFGITLDGSNLHVAEVLAVKALETLNIYVTNGLERVPHTFGYRHAFKERSTGMIVEVSENLSVQGIKVQASGGVLRQIPDRMLLLSYALSGGWRVTRIDVAIDAMDTDVRVSEIKRAYEDNVLRSVQRKYRYIEKGKEQTIEIGSRTSEKFLRVYDKAAEQHLNVSWVRFEIECKGNYGQNMANAVNESTAIVAIPVILRMLQHPETKHWLLDAIAQLAEGHEYVSAEQVKTVGDTFLWLKTQVLPSLVKLYYTNNGDFRAFEEQLNQAIIDAQFKYQVGD